MEEIAGYNWAYERLHDLLVLPTDKDDIRIMSVASNQRLTLLQALVEQRFPARKAGVLRCCQDFLRAQDAHATILHSRCQLFQAPCLRQKCQLCAALVHNIDDHSDMHYRLQCIYERIADPSKTFAKKRPKVSVPLSAKSVRKLEKELQEPDLKPATRKRMHAQLATATTTVLALQQCGMSRGWFVATNVWTKPTICEERKTVPLDVLAFGRRPCVRHPQRSFWQETFPHLSIPLHWQPHMLLDQSAVREAPLQPLSLPKKRIVTTDNIHEKRRCTVCNELFVVTDAPNNCEKQYMLVDACPMAKLGVVHAKCARAMVEQDRARVQEFESTKRAKKGVFTTDKWDHQKKCNVCQQTFGTLHAPSGLKNPYFLQDACRHPTLGLVHVQCS